MSNGRGPRRINSAVFQAVTYLSNTTLRQSLNPGWRVWKIQVTYPGIQALEAWNGVVQTPARRIIFPFLIVLTSLLARLHCLAPFKGAGVPVPPLVPRLPHPGRPRTVFRPIRLPKSTVCSHGAMLARLQSPVLTHQVVSNALDGPSAAER